MAVLAPTQPLKMRKEQGGYVTLDSQFRIEKVEGNRWSWFIKEAGTWVARDKRKYATKSWCEMCVEAYAEHINSELELWGE